jgi:hypothetical protein
MLIEIAPLTFHGKRGYCQMVNGSWVWGRNYILWGSTDTFRIRSALERLLSSVSQFRDFDSSDLRLLTFDPIFPCYPLSYYII